MLGNVEIRLLSIIFSSSVIPGGQRTSRILTSGNLSGKDNLPKAGIMWIRNRDL
jgi:hypothetical protein